jgi:uncharacterized membrane protein required for colicin V production
VIYVKFGIEHNRGGGLELNWLDIAILVVFLIVALDGMAKGFIFSFFNIIGVFVSLFIARYFTPGLAGFIIKNTPISERLKFAFDKRVNSLNPATLSLLNLLNLKNGNIEESLTIIFVNIACFLFIFFLCTILLNLFRDTLRRIVKKTPMKYMDKLGGLGIGIIKGALLIFVFFAVVTPLMGLMPQSSELVTAIGTSKLAKYFYLYNFIIPWMQKITYI